MKTMCPPSYHRNGFVAIHALDARLRIAGTNEQESAQQTKLVA